VARSQSIWQPTATGTYNWDLAANWSGGVPDGATANASFTALLTGNQTINLVANRTLNILTIGSSGGTYTLAGTQVLTLGGTTPTVTMVANSQNVFLNMNTLALGAAATITNNSTVGTLNIGVAGTSTIANGTNGLTLDGPGAITVNSVFTGTTGAITKNGTGVVTFTDLNAFGTPNTATAYGTVTTGNITVNGGGIIVGNLRLTAPGMNPNRTPGGTVVPRTLIIANGAFAQVNGTLSIDPSSSTYVTLVSGAGTLRLRNGTSTLANPSLTADHGPSGGDADPWGSVIATPVDIGAGTHWFVGKTNRNDVSRYAGDLRFDGPFTGTGNIQVRGTNNNNNRNWQLVFNANNSGYTGSVFIANTSLHLTNVSALTAANAVTFNTVVDANTQNQGGIFLWGRNLTIGSLNDTSEATTSNFIRNGARDLANGGTNANNNAATNGVALGVNADSILTVTQTTDGTFGGIISDGPNDNGTGDTGTYRTLGITKAGTATLTLTGANTFTGPLTVVNGVLVLNGANATANTTVNGGTLRIGASGSLPNGPVVMGSGGVFDVTATGFTFNTGRTFTVGRSGTAANDVLGSVTVAGTLNIGPANEARTATFANNLTLNGANVGFSLGTATTIGSGVNDLVVVGGNLTLTGTNNIVITQLGGSLASGTYTLFQYTGTVTGGAANLALSGVTTGTTRQTFTFNTTAASNGAVTLAVAGNPANLTWVGNAASNVWDLVTTVNWTGAPGATPDNRFYNLDTVLFNDTGVGGATNVTLTGTLAPGSITVNATQNYTFAGTGTLAGNTGLTKQGTGTLTLLTNNTYSGGTTVSAGVLNVGNGGTTGTITGALTNNASVVFNRSDALTFAGVISGNGTITKSGTGALTLSGTNTYTGTTTVTAGTLVISSDASLGAAPAALVANQLTLASGTTLQASAGFTMAANRGIALGGPVTIDTQANTVVINGPMSGAGAALTKIGTGSLTLVGANTYTGGTNLNAGALGFETGASLGTGTITVAAGVTNQASITSTPGAPFLFHTATADVTLANNIVLPAPTSDTTYTFVKQSSGGQINFTGVISGGNAATKLFLNSTTGGDNTTTYRFAGNNTFRASIELWRGGIVVGSATGLGDAANFIRLNGNNNTTLGDLRFDFSGTVANQFEIVDGGGGGIGVIGTNSVTLSGTILGTGTGTPLRKVGTGTLTLTGANTYVGATLVDAGTLLVNGNHAGATGAVTVAPGATLGGTGTIATAVTVNGAANNPGLLRGGNAAGAGTLTLTNGLTLTANSGINYRITGGNPSTTAGGSSVGTAPNFTSNNYVNVTGGTLTVAAGDIPTLRFIIDGTGTTFTMNQAYSYRVAQVAGQDLSGVQLTGATFQGQFSTVGFQAINFSLTGDTAGILYLGFTPVPEPGTILGIGTVVMGIGAWVRKRRQQT
jgi:autotransporter-associated beta strand protein